MELLMKIKILYWFLVTVIILSIAVIAGSFDSLPSFKPDANMSRTDIPGIFKWNLKDLCENDDKWDEETKICQDKLKSIKDYHTKLNTADGLVDYLETYFDLDERINRLTLYANLQRDVEATNKEAISRHELGLNLTEQIMQEGITLRQTVLDLSEEDLKKYIENALAINKYLPYINSLRRRADRVLSPEEEKLLSMVGDNLWAQIDINELPAAPEKAFRALTSEMTLPMVLGPDRKPVRLTFSNYGRLRGSDKREVRKSAVAGMFNTLKDLENTFATTLGEQAKFSLFLSRARGYETVLEAYLDKDDLTPDVYFNLVNTVIANVKPLHKYVNLRKKALKLDEVHLYDLYVPMVEEVSINMDYKNGSKIILDALQPMGDNYLKSLELGLNPENGWIDIYPSNDKNSGAFSTATYGIHPYVKMNFQDTFDDVSTLAHEYGHALHSYYALQSQTYLSWRYAPFLAEIASTCNEALLSQYMIKNAKSDQEKAWFLSELLETIRTTIFRQALFAEFELKLHKLAEAGEPITAEKLNNIYTNLIHTYYGPDFTMDENDHMEWAYIPHFYYKYYVFTYATGLSSGIAFADKIIKEGEPAREAYLGMLKGGSSKPPLVLLKEAGLDLTKPAAIESALNLFDKTIDQLEELLEK
jgi:oligoendopeptidase F